MVVMEYSDPPQGWQTLQRLTIPESPELHGALHQALQDSPFPVPGMCPWDPMAPKHLLQKVMLSPNQV